MPNNKDFGVLRIQLSASSLGRLQRLSISSGRSLPKLVSDGLILVDAILREQANGNRCVIATPENRAIKEIVLPT
jgi:hypothetical protein